MVKLQKKQKTIEDENCKHARERERERERGVKLMGREKKDLGGPDLNPGPSDFQLSYWAWSLAGTMLAMDMYVHVHVHAQNHP